jgi:DNA-binding transcriptional LysR family regulator
MIWLFLRLLLADALKLGHSVTWSLCHLEAKQMELTHLRYFIAVAEELHFGRAAKRVHIAQPPLSQSIRKLEDELGTALFIRTSRKVELTSAGSLFLEEARAIVSRAENSVQAMRQYAGGSKGCLALGFNEPAINTFLSTAIREFIRKYPEVKLSLFELETAEQLKALSERRIHLGIMRPFNCDLGALESRLLLSEEYVLALPRGHRLCARSKIELSSLKNEKFIMFPKTIQPALFECLTQCFQKHGFTPDIVQEAVTKQTTLALVESGLGIALVPESSKRLSPPGVVFKSVVGKLPSVDIYAVWQRGYNSPIVNNFLETIRTGETPVPH